MKKCYLTMVLADEPEAVDIITKVDHQAAGPIEFVIGGQGIGLWRLLLTFLNLKYLLKDSYKKLNENVDEDTITDSR